MFRKKIIQKLSITTCALCALFMLYLIPKNKLNIKENIEYVDLEVKTNNIFLMDDNNYLGKTKVVINSKKTEDKVKELVEVLIKGGIGENRIPNGFRSLIPSDTKILSIEYKNDLIKIDFSKNLLDVNKDLEEKIIEAIVYTITSIDNVKNVSIYIEGNKLTVLPKSLIKLPDVLNRNFGINKTYNFNKINNINQVTTYYLNKHDDNYYYVPVTNYLNDDRDKIKIIIDELTSNNTYNPNLLSYLNSNTKLLSVEKQPDILELTFNSYIFSDITNKDILEEVIYTICLSIKDNYDVKEVIIKSLDEEIKTVLKEIN